MQIPMTGPMPRHGTRWSRTAPLILVCLAAMAGTLGLVQRNVLASAITYQGTTGQFSTSRVTGRDVGFGMSTMTSESSGGALSTKKVLRAGFATGTLNGFCLSQVQSLPVIGNVTIKLTAGDHNASTNEINAVNVQFDLADLRGNGTGVNLDGMVQLGLAAQDITTLAGVDNPLDAPTGVGYYGIDATAGDIFNARGHIYNAEIGGPMSLPNLSITVVPGGSQCGSDPLPD